MHPRTARLLLTVRVEPRDMYVDLIEVDDDGETSTAVDHYGDSDVITHKGTFPDVPFPAAIAGAITTLIGYANCRDYVVEVEGNTVRVLKS